MSLYVLVEGFLENLSEYICYYIRDVVRDVLISVTQSPGLIKWLESYHQLRPVAYQMLSSLSWSRMHQFTLEYALLHCLSACVLMSDWVI